LMEVGEMRRKYLLKYELTKKEKDKIAAYYPCLDMSFEDDYKSEVATLLEAQIKKVLKIIAKNNNNIIF